MLVAATFATAVEAWGTGVAGVGVDVDVSDGEVRIASGGVEGETVQGRSEEKEEEEKEEEVAHVPVTV